MILFVLLICIKLFFLFHSILQVLWKTANFEIFSRNGYIEIPSLKEDNSYKNIQIMDASRVIKIRIFWFGWTLNLYKTGPIIVIKFPSYWKFKKYKKNNKIWDKCHGDSTPSLNKTESSSNSSKCVPLGLQQRCTPLPLKNYIILNIQNIYFTNKMSENFLDGLMYPITCNYKILD